MLKEIIIHVHSVKETIASYHVKPHATKSVHIQAHTDVKYEFIEKSSGYAPENIATKRVGKDLHIAFEGNDINDPDLIIDDYYDHMGEVLTGKAEDGLYYDYVPESAQTSDAVSGLHDGAFAGQALGGDGFMTPLWIEAGSFGLGTLGIVAGIGGIAAAAGGGGGGTETNENDNAPVFTPVTPGDTEYTFSYAENTAEGVTLGTVAATDADGTTPTFTIKTNEVDGAGDPIYQIDPNTGVISLTAEGVLAYANDFESGDNAQTIVVTATDGTNNTDITVNLTETNENDNAPVFTPVTPGDTEYTFSYAENTAEGVTLGTVAATDADGTTPTFTIKTNEVDGAGDPIYQIDPNTGVISLTAEGVLAYANDFESGDNAQTIVVTATDGTNNTDITVNLTETNENDNAPVFTPVTPGDTEYTFSYAENTAEGVTLGTVAATDADGTTPTFTIKTNEVDGAGDPIYQIDPNTGVISLTAEGVLAYANDFESGDNAQTIVVTATDGTNNTDITVNLTETNENDNAPVFTPVTPGDTEYTFSYAENTAEGVTLGTVAATDADGTTPTFTIKTNEVDGAGDPIYQIDPNTGVISLTAEGVLAYANDFESGDNAQTIVVTATDGTNNTDITVNLTETNENDNAPVFTPVTPGDTEYTFSYAENTAEGVTLGTVAATDADGTTPTFTIKTNEVDGAGDPIYQIDPNTGVISLTAEGVLAYANDFESGDNAQTIVVTATDGTNNTDITVNLTETNENDNAPVFTPVTPGDTEYTFSYAENTAEGVTLGTVAATDADGTTPTFTIKTNEVDGAGDPIYQIDPNTGVISLTAEGVLAYANDFESGDNAQTIVVTATDGTNNTDITVNLTETNENDNAPVFTPVTPGDTEYTFSYAENTAEGVTLGTVAATDADGTTPTFTIKTNEVDGAGDPIYQIDPNTGVISLTAEGVLAYANDFESGDNAQTIVVTATDGTNNTDITVNLTETNENDNAPVFTPVTPGDTEYTFSYAENTAEGVTLGTVAATDADGTTPTFTIKTNEVDGAGDPIYQIDPNTGVISLTAEGVLAYANDFESGDNAQTIVVTATDGTNNTDITVNLTETNENDNAPVFTPVTPGDTEYTFSYAENTAEGVTLGTVAATDADGTTPTFTIKTNEVDGAGDPIYQIDPNTGVISLTAEGVLAYANDFESGDNAQTIVVTATDGTNNTDITVNLTETNENDNAPVFTPVTPGDTEYTFSYAENTAEGVTLGTVAATDADGTTPTFTIKTNEVDGAGDPIYQIDPNTGVISLTAEGVLAYANDFESGDNAQTIVVTATDGTNNTDITVNLTETNENDNAPVFTPVTPGDTEYTFSYAENTAEGVTLGTVAATDADGTTPTFTIKTNEVDGAGDPIYQIDPNTGVISLTAEGVLAYANDFESGDNAQTIVVTATDGTNNTDITVNLTETNENDNAPVFTPVTPGDTEYTFSYAENTAEGVTLGTVAATDADGTTPTFTIKTNEVDGAGDPIYQIDPNTGVISLTAEGVLAYANDFESGDNAQTIVVTATDGTNNTDITVNLTETNENDNAPVFTPVTPGDTEYTFSYAENTAEGVTLGTVAATDADGTTPTFTIKTNEVDGAGDPIYQIDPNTGVISLTAEGVLAYANDFESGDNAQTIVVTATDGTNNTDITVNLTETNENDNAPAAADKSVGLAINTSDILEASDFGFSDLDGDTMASVKITDVSTVDDGQLLYNNNGTWESVIDNQVITKADIDAGYLIFKPATDGTGVPYDIFTFTVNDGANDSIAHTFTYNVATSLTVSNPAAIDEGKSTVFIIDLSDSRTVDTVLDLSIGGDVDTNDYNTALFYKDVDPVTGLWTWDPVAVGDQVTIASGDTRVEVKVTTIQNDDDNADGDNNQTTGTVDPTNESITLTASINGYAESDMANTIAIGQTVINDYPSLIVSSPVMVTEGNDAIFEVTLSGKKTDTTDVVLSLGGEVDTADYDTTGYAYSIDDGATWISVVGNIEGATLTIPLSTTDGGVDDRIQSVLVKVTTLLNDDAGTPDMDETLIFTATTTDIGVANVNTNVSADTLIVETISIDTNEDAAYTTLVAPTGYTYSVLGQGTNGTVTDDGSGTLTYDPDTNTSDGLDTHFSGTDSFTIIKTNDASGLSTTAIVNVNVIAVADTPTIGITINNSVETTIVAPELITNGDFQANTTYVDGEDLDDPNAVTGWILDTPTEIILTAGDYELNLTDPQNGNETSITQTITALSAGSANDHTVTLDYSATNNSTAGIVYWGYIDAGGSFVSTNTIGTFNTSGGLSGTFSGNITAAMIDGTSDTIQIAGTLSGGAASKFGIIIDNVSLTGGSTTTYTYNVNITNSLNDTDTKSAQPEQLQDVIITGVPDSAIFNNGVQTVPGVNNSWTFTQADLVGLTITMSDTDATTGFTLTSTTTSMELSNSDLSSVATDSAIYTQVVEPNDVPIIGSNTLIMANEAGFSGTVSNSIETYFSSDSGNFFSWDASITPEIFADGQLIDIVYATADTDFDGLDDVGTVTGTINGGVDTIFTVTVDMNGTDGTTEQTTNVTYDQPNELLGIKEVIDGGIVLPGGGNSDMVILGFNNSDGSVSGVDAIVTAHNLIEDSAAEIASPEAEHTVNTNNFYIGVNSNNMNAGQQLIMDFATVATDAFGNTTHSNDVAEIEIKLFNFGSEKSGDELFIRIETASGYENILLTQDSDYSSELEYTVQSSSGESILSVEFLAGNESLFKLGIKSISAIDYNTDFDMDLRYLITDSDGDNDTGSVIISLDGDEFVIYDASKTSIDSGTEQPVLGGNDTLLFESDGDGIDFSLLNNPEIKNFEVIDLGPNGDHTLSNLSLDDVLTMTDSNNVLTILGNTGDSVTTVDALTGGWTEVSDNGINGNGDGTRTYTYTNTVDTVTLTISDIIDSTVL